MFENVGNAQVVEMSEEDLMLATGETPADKNKGKKDAGKGAPAAGADGGNTGDDNSQGQPADKKNKTKSSKDKGALTSVPDPNSPLPTEELSEEDLQKLTGKTADGKDIDDDGNPGGDDGGDDDDENKQDGDDDDDDDDDDENKGADSPVSVSDFLKARAELLIKQGAWVDFEGREEIEEWDEETWEEVEANQAAFQDAARREEILESFGPLGKQLADYASKGGDPNKLLDIFKLDQQIQALSIDTKEGQQAAILQYRIDVLGETKERAQRYLKSLPDEELAQEAADIKKDTEAKSKAKAAALQQEQTAKVAAAAQQRQATIEKFAADVNGFLNAATDIPAEEKKLLSKVLTQYNKKLENGTPVNEFYFRLAEFKKDLPNYMKLVRLVMDPKKYDKAVGTKAGNEKTQKAFNLIRTGNQGKTGKGKAAGADSGNTNTKRTKFTL